jgi:hypothetical protein
MKKRTNAPPRANSEAEKMLVSFAKKGLKQGEYML